MLNMGLLFLPFLSGQFANVSNSSFVMILEATYIC